MHLVSVIFLVRGECAKKPDIANIDREKSLKTDATHRTF